MALIDRSSPIPLYHQLKQILLDRIGAKEWQPGDLIPSELELQEIYGLSRTTVRQTLAELVTAGHLDRQRGRGTFVAAPKIAHDPTSRLGISENIEALGLTPEWLVLHRGWEQAPRAIAAALEISEDDSVYEIALLLSTDGQPIGHHTSYLPEHIGRQIASGELIDTEILDFLKALPISHKADSERYFESLPAAAKEVELLRMRLGAPVLAIDLKFLGRDGAPIEYLVTRFRGDRFRYQLSR
jgi:GntR family transcriptional regulator